MRHFIYLDTEKLYSISSQLFNGFTDSVVSEISSQECTDEQQKMLWGKGKQLGHLFTEASKSIEKKFLHDQALVSLEDKLLENQDLLELNNSNSESISNETLLSKKFIKLTAKVQISDYLELKSLLQNFNDLGQSITFLSHIEEVMIAKEAQKLIKQTSDRNEKARLQAMIKGSPNMEEIALEEGLRLDPDLIKHILNMVSYRYTDEFIFSQNLSNKVFNSIINRKYLREPENLLKRKYQETHKNLVIIGSVCQLHVDKDVAEIKDNFDNLKEIVQNLALVKQNLDISIDGLMENEVIIDPIAAYFE